MDTLSKAQIESALAARLPSYTVECTLHADGTLSAVLSGPGTDHFAITGIVRAHYHGTEAINQLATDQHALRTGQKSGRAGTQFYSVKHLHLLVSCVGFYVMQFPVGRTEVRPTKI